MALLSEIDTLSSLFADGGLPRDSNFTAILRKDYSSGADPREGGSKAVVQDIDMFLQVLIEITKPLQSEKELSLRFLDPLLYFIDFDYYELNEETFMGGLYLKGRQGPVSHELGIITGQMKGPVGCSHLFAKCYELRQALLDSYDSAHFKDCSEEEKSFIHDQMRRCLNMPLAELEAYARGDFPYIMAENGHLVDYWYVDFRGPEYTRCENGHRI